MGLPRYEGIDPITGLELQAQQIVNNIVYNILPAPIIENIINILQEVVPPDPYVNSFNAQFPMIEVSLTLV